MSDPIAELSPEGARVRVRRDLDLGGVVRDRQLRHVPQAPLRREQLRRGEQPQEQPRGHGAAGHAEAAAR